MIEPLASLVVRFPTFKAGYLGFDFQEFHKDFTLRVVTLRLTLKNVCLSSKKRAKGVDSMKKRNLVLISK